MILVLWVCKVVAHVSVLFRRGGGTWPGHLMLLYSTRALSWLLPKHVPFIVVAGTNGKTTTTACITGFLTHKGYRVVTNATGANLVNGIVSALIRACSWRGTVQADYIVCEVDENALPLLMQMVPLHTLVVLNVFRDQLDRYGEVDTILGIWREISVTHPPRAVIANAQDPGVVWAFDEADTKKTYFSLGNEVEHPVRVQSVSDSDRCPWCATPLLYAYRIYSHIGEWSCPACHRHAPSSAEEGGSYLLRLPGRYNQANVAAVIVTLTQLGFHRAESIAYLSTVMPVFGRGEVISSSENSFLLLLAKNPTGFNESLQVACADHVHAPCVVFCLNDSIPDGRDISWIWDIPFESYVFPWSTIVVAGSRADDFAVRLQYAHGSLLPYHLEVCHSLMSAVQKSKEISGLQGNTHAIPILATYSAMLDIRRILTGRSLQ